MNQYKNNCRINMSLIGNLCMLMLLSMWLIFPAMASNNQPLLNDPIPPVLETAELGERTLAWSELGDPYGKPLIFAVGFPHAASAGAGVLSVFDEYLKRKGVRLIAVERTGATNFSTFDPNDTLDGYVVDVVNLTAHLGINKFSVLAFSAGGPGALALAAQLPERVNTVHLMAARGRYEDALAERSGEQGAFEALINDPFAFAPFFQNFPPARFLFSQNSQDFMDANFGTDFIDVFLNEGIQNLNQNPEGLSLSRAIGYQPWSFELADVQAPVFVYQGWEDSSILAEGFSQDTPARVSGVATVRFYPGEGHFQTHMRHLDQVVEDMQHLGNRIIMCDNSSNRPKTRQVFVRQTRQRLLQGYTYGNCVWQ